MIGVGCSTGCDHTAKIPGGNSIYGRTADSHMLIGVAGTDPTRAHGAVLTTGRARSDWTRLNRFSPIKEEFHPVSSGFGNHLLGGFTGGDIFGSNYLLGLSHNSSMVWI